MKCTNLKAVPLRVDFAGGWLDVPKFARPEGFIVNCAIEPLVTKETWVYEKEGGLGGSAAWSILNGVDAIEHELATAGWQDPAVILETGLCVWQSGPRPELIAKLNPSWLEGKMALLWTGKPHDQPTGEAVNFERDYDLIAQAAIHAKRGVLAENVQTLMQAIGSSYATQLEEGMKPLPLVPGVDCARKYCGSGFGGYAVYVFANKSAREMWVRGNPNSRRIEPYLRALRQCDV